MDSSVNSSIDFPNVQTPGNLNGHAERLHAEKSYRPVAVALIENRQNELLFVQAADTRRWGFLQGGVERSESVFRGLIREMGEETEGTIVPRVIDSYSYLLTDSIRNFRKSLNGFVQGACYFYFHVEYYGPREIRLQHTELSDYRWLTRRGAVELIESFGETYGKKKNSMLMALRFLLAS